MTYFLIQSSTLGKYSVQVPELYKWTGWLPTQAEALVNSNTLHSKDWVGCESLADYRAKFAGRICFEFTETSNPEFFI
jgi:hypothetical protein